MSRAAWVVGEGRVELREAPPRQVGPGEVRVRALYSGVSRGTEALVLRGDVPVSEHQRMRCPFQEGDFPFPVKYGYMSVGEVIEGGPSGQRVFCLHPHQDHYVVPSNAVIPLPEGVPPARAVLAANLETAINGVWDAEIGPGDRVGIVGAGVVGASVAWLAAGIPGTEVTVIDIDPSRQGLAHGLGAAFAGPADAPDGLDCVLHCSGDPQGLVTALALAGPEALIVDLSWYGTQQVSLPLGAAFHSQRLTLRSSQVGAISPRRRPRWSHRRRLGLALELLRADALDALIDSEGTLEALPADLPRVISSSGLCHRIDYTR